MDMGSKMNRFGGEARVAAQLHSKLGAFFKTFYLGYETQYLKCEGNCYIIKRERVKLSGAMRTGLSENWIMRAGYYFLAGRMINIGITKKEIIEVFSHAKPDVAIANSLADFPVLRFASKYFKFKKIYIDHVNLSGDVFKGMLSKNSLPFSLGTGMLPIGIEPMKRKFFSFFDANVALNMEQEEKMKRYTKNVYYIPNGIAKAKKEKSSAKRFADRYGLAGKFVVLYVGRMFERQKNVSTLIKAFKLVDENEMMLLLIGEGPSLESYIKLAKGDPRIVFTGSLSDNELEAAYSISSLYVLPSFWEGFSITMLESAAHSIPMLLSKKAYPKEFEKLGIDIVRFDPTNERELATKIKSMKEDKIMYQRAKEASRKIADAFSEEKMIKRYKELVEALAK